MRILLPLLFMAALTYSIYAQTTAALIPVLVIAAVGIVYSIYEIKSKKRAKNI
jgi:hypothetical protein